MLLIVILAALLTPSTFLTWVNWRGPIDLLPFSKLLWLVLVLLDSVTDEYYILQEATVY